METKDLELLKEYFKLKRGRMTVQQLRRITCIVSKRRREIHKNHSSQRVLTPDYEEKGLLGELVFGEIIDIRADLSDRPSGDDYDFMTTLGPLDVKTSQTNKLYVEAVKLKIPYIYVHGRFRHNNVVFKGWTTGRELVKKPTEISRFRINNYTMTESELRPMDELYNQLGINTSDGFLTI